MGYDAGRNRKNELLLFTAGKRNGVLWDLSTTNVLRHKRLSRRSGEHEAEKPVELFWQLAKTLTRAGDVVADFFVGRGRWIQKLLDEGRHVVAVDAKHMRRAKERSDRRVEYREKKWVEAIAGEWRQRTVI